MMAELLSLLPYGQTAVFVWMALEIKHLRETFQIHMETHHG